MVDLSDLTGEKGNEIMNYVLITLKDGEIYKVKGYTFLEEAETDLMKEYSKTLSKINSPDIINNIVSFKDAYIFSEIKKLEISWHIRTL